MNSFYLKNQSYLFTGHKETRMNLFNTVNHTKKSSSIFDCACEAKVSVEYFMGRPAKTTIDAGKGNDAIHIHTNFNGSVDVTVNGQKYHFTTEQAQNLEIKGGKGNDCITSSGAACTSQPNITIRGGKGNDLIIGGSANETIYGGRGNDLIFGGKGDDTIKGGRGKDLIFGGAGDDDIKGGRGSDVIFGGKGDDNIKGGRGNDVIFGGKGDDCIHGGKGNDTIFGGRGNDTIEGGRGTDLIFGDQGDDGIHADTAVKPETSFNKEKGTASWENINYKITALESNSQLLVENKNTGEVYRIWGDPHVDVDGKRSFDFKKDAVFKLDDGTEIHIKTVDFGRNTNFTLSSDVTILDGQSDSAVQWNNMDQNVKGDMKQVITTKDKVHCNDLISESNGLVFEEADGADKKGFEILNKNSVLEALSNSVRANTAKVTETENALGK